MARIRFDGVSKRYGDVVAVRSLNLDIHDREFVVLLGPSGCGKSTTLNVIAGLEEASEGELWFDNEVVNRIPPHRRDVAMVFQSYALYPHKTAYENIAFGLRMGWPPLKLSAECRMRRRSSTSRACSAGGRASCRAGSASVSRSAAPWCANPRSS